MTCVGPAGSIFAGRSRGKQSRQKNGERISGITVNWASCNYSSSHVSPLQTAEAAYRARELPACYVGAFNWTNLFLSNVLHINYDIDKKVNRLNVQIIFFSNFAVSALFLMQHSSKCNRIDLLCSKFKPELSHGF